MKLGQTDYILNTPFFRIYSSDLGRTMETTRLLRLDGTVAPLVDKRLRELAKGAREGFPKDTTYTDAVKLRDGKHIPRLESNGEATRRLLHWVVDVVRCATVNRPLSNNDVLAISHSGSIRTLLHALVPHSIPEGSLTIPNLSVTIIELVVRETAYHEISQYQYSPKVTDLWDAKLLKLCWCPHLEEDYKA
jgi:broad specificity phosphatase PhoE